MRAPQGAQPYRRTPTVNEATVPEGLLKAHATKDGVWGVVGVLEGRELETRYDLHNTGENTVLVRTQEAFYYPGEVCALVPPVEDIHKVANGSDDHEHVTISMHIYGDNIAQLGTSINQIFKNDVVDSLTEGSNPVSWRAQV